MGFRLICGSTTEKPNRSWSPRERRSLIRFWPPLLVRIVCGEAEKMSNQRNVLSQRTSSGYHGEQPSDGHLQSSQSSPNFCPTLRWILCRQMSSSRGLEVFCRSEGWSGRFFSLLFQEPSDGNGRCCSVRCSSSPPFSSSSSQTTSYRFTSRGSSRDSVRESWWWFCRCTREKLQVPIAGKFQLCFLIKLTSFELSEEFCRASSKSDLSVSTAGDWRHLVDGESSRESLQACFHSIFKLFFLSVGILYAYCIGPYVSYVMFQWLCLVIPVIFVVTFAFIPDSPHYYVSKGLRHKAIKSLKFLRHKSSDDVSEELEEIETSVAQSLSHRATIFDVFRGRANLTGKLNFQNSFKHILNVFRSQLWRLALDSSASRTSRESTRFCSTAKRSSTKLAARWTPPWPQSSLALWCSCRVASRRSSSTVPAEKACCWSPLPEWLWAWLPWEFISSSTRATWWPVSAGFPWRPSSASFCSTASASDRFRSRC